MFIPDCQVKPESPIEHLKWAAQYAVEKKPDVIICAGDFSDMESLSSYDVGKKNYEGRRYKKDVEASHLGMRTFMQPIIDEQARQRRNKEKIWTPRKVLTVGNHEHRINRATNDDSKLDGLISIDDLQYEKYGWEVIPFLEVVVIDGIAYSHYFVSGIMGRPVTSARALLTKHHMSCVAGHQQGRDIAFGKSASGKSMTALISGSFYQHDEDYLTAQNNIHWRGIWIFNEVEDGAFDELPISLRYLKNRYDVPKNKMIVDVSKVTC